MPVFRRPIALSAAVATAAATAFVVVPSVQANAAAGRLPIPISRVYITKNNHIRMATQLRSGMREFVINAAGHSSFQLAKARPGYTKAAATSDIRAGLAQGNDASALRRFERNLRGLGGVSAGPKHTGHMWRNLKPGTYWALETTGDPTANRILTVHVRGSRLRTTPLASTGGIRAVRSIRWAKMPRSIPHAGILKFTNDSRDNHVLVMIKLAKGKTIRDFRRWVNSGAQSPPPLTGQQFSFGLLSPNSQMAGSYSQPRGKYVLLCFWPDVNRQGRPHFLLGMYRGLRLT